MVSVVRASGKYMVEKKSSAMFPALRFCAPAEQRSELSGHVGMLTTLTMLIMQMQMFKGNLSLRLLLPTEKQITVPHVLCLRLVPSGSEFWYTSVTRWLTAYKYLGIIIDPNRFNHILKPRSQVRCYLKLE